ncbi:NADPH-dependent F420 reductase [Nonomuraea sediminis]|uniref:NADPH-dependent F420 reductase n=1 Tax=Nonomuraea sediminis TaxID=2835864 RepID=UPI001BDCE600|nr:NAD(P)-binding domain-containing protein [Nonomuraea sediminis]
MRVGILGAGAMAVALGGGWATAGHEVLVGARDQDRAGKAAGSIGAGARAGTLREAAGFGEAVLLAVPAAAVADVLAACGGALDGRTVIDCTNAFQPDQAAPGGVMAFVLSEEAVAEKVAALAPEARVVKAFNLCAAEVWAASEVRLFEGRRLAVPLCGDDAVALDLTAGLATDLGLHPVRAGGLNRARYLEATSVFVVSLWFAGHDARAMFPPLEHTFAEAD